MESIVFGLAIFCIGYIFFWSIVNDGAKSISEQRGLIRMQDPEKADDEPTPKVR